MKTKKTILALLLLATISTSTFLGCGQHDFTEDEIKWSDDNGGTLEVQNNSNKDMILFVGQSPKPDDIMGGVRSGKSKTFDISKHVSDFGVGGYAIIRGVSRDEYNEKRFDLSNAKWEFSSMVTYKADIKYRINIDLAYTGDYAVRLTNKAKVGLELRKNSPQGEKVAYLPASSVNNMLYAQTSAAITLFPVYVFYNRTTQEVNTLYATDLEESITVSPRSAKDLTKLLTYYLPFNAEDAWIQIMKKLKSPVAYISVQNGMDNQSIYFTNAGSTWLYSQEGYDAIGPGEKLIFELKAEDWDEDTETGGQRMNLKVTYQGAKQIDVRFADKAGNIINALPLIKNGYNYTVNVEPDLSNVGTYIAIIEEGKKRDLSEMIEIK